MKNSFLNQTADKCVEKLKERGHDHHHAETEVLKVLSMLKGKDPYTAQKILSAVFLDKPWMKA